MDKLFDKIYGQKCTCCGTFYFLFEDLMLTGRCKKCEQDFITPENDDMIPSKWKNIIFERKEE